MRLISRPLIVQSPCASLQRSEKKRVVGQIATQSQLFRTILCVSLERLYVRRLRAGGRSMRGENSSGESDEEPSDSDESVGDIEDHTGDSLGGRSPNSEDDPPENRRPGRDARTRANVTFSLYCYCVC